MPLSRAIHWPILTVAGPAVGVAEEARRALVAALAAVSLPALARALLLVADSGLGAGTVTVTVCGGGRGGRSVGTKGVSDGREVVVRKWHVRDREETTR